MTGLASSYKPESVTGLASLYKPDSVTGLLSYLIPLLEKRQVSQALGEKLAAKWGTGFIETSAKNNENVTEMFEKLLAMEKKRQLTLTMDESDGKAAHKRKCVLM